MMPPPPPSGRASRLQTWLEFIAGVAGAAVPWASGLAAGMKLLVEFSSHHPEWSPRLPPAPDARARLAPAAAEAELHKLLEAIEQSPPEQLSPEILAEILGYRTLWQLYPELHGRWLLATHSGQPLVPFIELWHAEFRPDAPALPLSFQRCLDRYQPPGHTLSLGARVDALTVPKLKSNEAKLRICQVDITGTGLVMHFSVCDYLDYLRTHWAMANLGPAHALELRRALCGAGPLLPLDQTRCPNDLGVSAVVAFGDEIILPVSSPEVISSPNMIVPSASGSADFMPSYWHDGVPSPAQDILRETQEELKVDIRDFREAQVRLLGLTRNVLRGGKPEAFYYLHLPMRFAGTASSEHRTDSILRLPALLAADNTPVAGFDRHLDDIQAFIHRQSGPGEVLSPFTRVALHYYVLFAKGCRHAARKSSS